MECDLFFLLINIINSVITKTSVYTNSAIKPNANINPPASAPPKEDEELFITDMEISIHKPKGT